MKGPGGMVLVSPCTCLVNYLSSLRPDHPNGIFPIADVEVLSRPRRGNPFDSPIDSPLSSSPSSSEDELYTHALSLQTPIAPTQATRRPPPPPPGKTAEVE
jgi:synaptojanin